MRPSESLKVYIDYFQNQLAKVHNYSEDRSLRVTHPLYKYLVKYNVTHWSEVLYRAKPDIQLEEAMKSSINPSLNRSDN